MPKEMESEVTARMDELIKQGMPDAEVLQQVREEFNLGRFSKGEYATGPQTPAPAPTEPPSAFDESQLGPTAMMGGPAGVAPSPTRELTPQVPEGPLTKAAKTMEGYTPGGFVSPEMGLAQRTLAKREQLKQKGEVLKTGEPSLWADPKSAIERFGESQVPFYEQLAGIKEVNQDTAMEAAGLIAYGALFGEVGRGVFGKVGEWFRGLTNKERGLVLQSAEELSARAQAQRASVKNDFKARSEELKAKYPTAAESYTPKDADLFIKEMEISGQILTEAEIKNLGYTTGELARLNKTLKEQEIRLREKGEGVTQATPGVRTLKGMEEPLPEITPEEKAAIREKAVKTEPTEIDKKIAEQEKKVEAAKPKVPPVEEAKAEVPPEALPTPEAPPEEVLQPVQGGGVKEPWEMTPNEYKTAGLGNANDVEVLGALREGKAVNARAVDDQGLKHRLPEGYTRVGDMFVPPEAPQAPQKVEAKGETATPPEKPEIAPVEAQGKGKEPLSIPEGWTTAIQPNWRKTPGWQAEVDWKDKRLVFESEADAKDPAIVNHEIGHVQIEDKLGDIQKLSDSPLLEEYSKLMRAPDDMHINFIREHLAMDYGDYLTSPEKVNPDLKTFFEKHFKKEATNAVDTGKREEGAVEQHKGTGKPLQGKWYDRDIPSGESTKGIQPSRSDLPGQTGVAKPKRQKETPVLEKPLNVIAWIKSKGGINSTDPSADIEAWGRAGGKGPVGLVRKDGQYLDVLAQMGEAEGDLPKGTTTDDLAQMITDSIFGGKKGAPITNEAIRKAEEAHIKAQMEQDPHFLQSDTINSLTDTIDNEIMDLRKDLEADGVPEHLIEREVGSAETAYKNEAPPEDLAEEELHEWFDLEEREEAAAPEATPELKPAPSPTKKGETLLPGMKVGLEMPKEGIKGEPTLEGSPLMEAAKKAEEEGQPTIEGIGETKKPDKAKIIPTRQGIVVQPEGEEGHLVGEKPGRLEIGDYVKPKKDSGIGFASGKSQRVQHIRTNPDGSRWIKTNETGNMHFKESDWEKVTPPEEIKQTPSSTVASWVKDRLTLGTPFEKAELMQKAAEAYGGTISEGKYNAKDAFDAMEMGINQYIVDRGKQFDPTVDLPQQARLSIDAIRQEIMEKIPSQSGIRTPEMDEFQQFSTPPDLAYTMAWTGNITPKDTVLEPSAGIGGIASFAKVAGAKTIVNELSPRRADLLKQMGFDQVFTENAEQINNILPKDVKPTVVLMNPPFSSTAGRIQGQRKSANVVTHLDQAFKRLEDGGRMVALIGKGWFADPKAVTDWLKNIVDKYNLSANIVVGGKGYAKYGTNYDNRILVIDKTPPTGKPTVTGTVEDVKDAIPLLQEVRDARIAAEPRQPEQEVQKVPARVEGASGPEPTVLPSTYVVGPGQRETPGKGQPVKGQPGGTSRGEPNKGVPVVENVGGRGAVPASEQPEPIQGAGGPVVGTPGRPGLETKPSPEGLSEREKSTVTLEQTKEEENPTDLTDSLYENYKPKKAIVKGSKPHPGPIVESAAMSSVDPPDAKYSPNLPANVIESGKLSNVQLESIIYAGQAHSEFLPGTQWFDKEGNPVEARNVTDDSVSKAVRQGYFIGDGTGVGKGREIAGIFFDNWRQGRKKGIWLSQNSPLIEDAKRDVKGTGFNPDVVFDFGKIKAGSQVKNKEGIAFVGYDLLRWKKKQVTEPGQPAAPEVSRLNQLIDWFGKDYDGVIAFDESHNMGNAIETQGTRGRKKASAKALSGIALQNALPNARIVYVSATGATEVMNFAYARRLGLWGQGAAFADVNDFINKISGGGMANLEMVASNLKAMGKYTARSLSYDGVKYSRMEHTLTPAQREVYDELAGAWQIVLQNINAALEATGVTSPNPQTGRPQTLNGQAKSAAMSAFWGNHQRFFNQIITAMQMPTVVKNIETDLGKGNSVVLQLVNTNEAATNRALSKMEEEDTLEDLDLTPREQLMQFIQHSFPVNEYHEVMDADGNIKSELTVDSNGNPVQNAEAVAMRDALLDRLGSIKVPDNPLDMIINHFGVDKVAEVSGRTRRVIEVTDEKGTHRIVDKRSKAKAMNDADAFMNNKKQILAFTYAGGTGRSYHADLTAKNQSPRMHYLVQPGWRADRAVQGLGRTHRTNQAQPPEYFLVTTDLKGQKRFISSIARRLDQLGALTKGQRQTGGQGLFSERDNLESQYANDALDALVEDVSRGNVPDMTLREFSDQLGINLIDDRTGNLNVTAIPEVPQFLNRILSMKIDMQDKVFDLFSEKLDLEIAKAIQNGTLDAGLETVRANKIEKISEQVVYTDPRTGAKTKFVELDLTRDAHIIPWEKSDRFSKGGYVQNIKSGRVWALSEAKSKTNARTGDVTTAYTATGMNYGVHNLESEDINDPEKYVKLTKAQAKDLWQKEYEVTPKEVKDRQYLVTGALLPIYNRLPEGHARVVRLQTDKGERMLGRIIPPTLVSSVRERLGAETTAVKMTPQEVINNVFHHSYTVQLANGWTIIRRKVQGEERVEIKGPSYGEASLIKSYGVEQERVNWETRYFIPNSEKGVEAIGKLLDNNPIIRATPPERSAEDIVAHGHSDLEALRKARAGEKSAGRVVFGRPSSPERPAFEFADPAVEKSYQESLPKGEPILSQVGEYFTDIWHKMTRQYENLPRNKEFSQLQFDLNKLAKQKGVASYDAIVTLAKVLSGLKGENYDLFTRKVILDDLAREVEKGHDLPWGLTKDTVGPELDRINALIDQRPEIKAALDKRKQMWDTIKTEYTGTMKDIGFDVDDRLKNENYFRHQILEYVNLKGLFGTGKKLKTPTGRGFLKKRAGSELDINRDFIQPEYEVVSQMLYDIQVAKTIKNVDENYNIMSDLKARAKGMNNTAIMDMVFRPMAQAAWHPGMENAEGKEMTVEDLAQSLYRRTLNLKQAMGFKKLQRFAEDGSLPDLPSQKWSEVIDSIASGGSHEGTLPYLAWLLKNYPETPEGQAAALIFKGISGKKKYIEEALKAADAFQTWETIIPEGYNTWQPREGNIFYMADSIPAQLAEQLHTGALEELGVSKEDIRRALTMGGKRKQFVLKDEIIATLDELSKGRSDSVIGNADRALLKGWKVWQLISPRRMLKYNIRNMTGDADAAFVGNPRGFSDAPRATREIGATLFGKKEITGELKQFFDRGGFSANLQAQEMGELKDLWVFERLYRDQHPGVKDIPKGVWKKYWETARIATDAREALLRYANYLNYLDQMKKNPEGKPKNFGGSKPEEIMGLSDIRDRAYWLSNDLLGAYDRVSVMGNALRKYVFPFWSWKEVNFRRYVQFAKNAASDGQFSQTVGRAALGTLAKTPFMAFRVGKFLIMATAFWSALQVWNHTRFPDEEEELSEDQKSQPHIILGRDKDGKIIYFNRIGALGDFLDWFGLGEAPKYVDKYFKGEMTLKEISENMVKSPVNLVVQGVTPFIKTPAELITGRSLFPDIFKPQPIRNTGLYLARSLGLENEYTAVAGLPSRGYEESLKNFLVYSVDPGQAAYSDVMEDKRRWLEKQGKASEGFWLTPKANALYNIKLSLRYEDREALDKYMLEYISLGGKKSDIKESLKRMDPLSGLSGKDKHKFKQSLDEDQRKRLDQATKFYKETLRESKPLVNQSFSEQRRIYKENSLR
jgi:hypothetical protein